MYLAVYLAISRQKSSVQGSHHSSGARHHAHISSDYIIIIIIIIIIISVKLYKTKYIYYKNQAQLQKAGQQKMIKTNNVS